MPEINNIPYFLDTETSLEKIEANKTPFKRGLGWVVNNNNSEAQNRFALTPTRANIEIKDNYLPSEGNNKNVGVFESIITKELYYFNYNDKGFHGIYIINTETFEVTKVIIDQKLNFSIAQDAYISEHRVTLRITYDEDKRIKEKHLIFTDGRTPQKWINVIAAIKTDGFNAALYPYWELKQPHFDRDELIEYATRPSMIAPLVSPIQVTGNTINNNVLDTCYQFCYEFVYTDGRYTTTSPYSLPFWVKSEDFLSNNIIKKLKLELYAGSCMVEKITIYVRQNISGNGIGQLTWGNWYKYDTINKYTSCDDELPPKYWLRNNAWSNYNYNPIKNTIEYTFENNKLWQVVAQERVNRLYNEIPKRSVALSDLGDSVLLANNEYGFNNLECNVLDKIDIEVKEGSFGTCPKPLRKVTLYCYVGRDRIFQGNSEERKSDDLWLSQFGYVTGEDTKVRWGGIRYQDGVTYFDKDESDAFELNFGIGSGFKCYLKGTPYYAECEWCYVDTNGIINKIERQINSTKQDDVAFVNNIISKQGYFIGRFNFKVPAGRYVATIGRHNEDADFSGKSTYIMGLADHTKFSVSSYTDCVPHTTQNVRTIKSNAITDNSKEIEIDCTTQDVNVWGNGKDLFYIYTPFNGKGRTSNNCGALRDRWVFIEGYLKESVSSDIAISNFPYHLTEGGYCGQYTDKNGFFWGMSWGSSNQHNSKIKFTPKLNCSSIKEFEIAMYGGGGYRKVEPYFETYNNGAVGAGNRILIKGRVTDLTGNIGYSNISVHIKNSIIVYTNDNGYFTLILHNGTQQLLKGDIYFNAGGNFNISGQGCLPVSLPYFDEASTPCNATMINSPCDPNEYIHARCFPFCLEKRLFIEGDNQISIKSNSNYEIGIVIADLAGRLSFVNKFKNVRIPSYIDIGRVAPFYLKWVLNGELNLPPEAKWAAFYISKNVTYKRYIQWIGDSIEFIDSIGKKTTDINNAALASIKIDSLLETNIKNNFSLFSNYQFQKGDRIRIIDNGEGELFDNTTNNSGIDVQIEGTNYNDAATSAGLLPQRESVVKDVTDHTTIIIKYGNKLNKLKNKKGFWIELYQNDKEKEQLLFYEVASFYPVINGELAEFVVGGSNNAQYNFPQSGNLDYWDTYLIHRNITIPNKGRQYIPHTFESPNITDKWGANMISGGRTGIENEDAQQKWALDDIIKSNDFTNNGLINGVATFISSNRKQFRGYKRGGIVAVKAINSYIFFLCENDYFTTDFNFHYARVNEQGVMVVNLNNGVSEPHQKIGNNYGCNINDNQSIIMHDNFIGWHDRKSGSYIFSDYRQAIEITEKILSYYSAKNSFVIKHNETQIDSLKIDILAGLDSERKMLYISFRPRRGLTKNKNSFINNKREICINLQETLCYSIEAKDWVMFESFVPEAYAKITGGEMITFANGVPYRHFSPEVNMVNNFYGVNVAPCLVQVVNTSTETNKILKYLVQNNNNIVLWVDEISTIQPNSFSYIPLNLFIKKENIIYASSLRDGASYPQQNDNFRNMLFDGKKLSSPYFLIRYCWDKNKLNEYAEIYSLATNIIPQVQKTQE